MSCNCGQTADCAGNPCAATGTNTAACETLPSIMQNFITHFFGVVEKTEVDGAVMWVLPCNLDVGLEGNPRNEGEGLACYFLRLLGGEVAGLIGPVGPTGADGQDGNNAYSITLSGFTQPTTGAPNWSVRLVANPAIRVGQTVFIEGSGYHIVTSISSDWIVFLTLVEGLPGVFGSISAGKLVTVAGPRGVMGATGATGATGPAGPQGTPGAAHTVTNNLVVGIGNPRDLTVDYQIVVFGSQEPEVTLPAAGKYLVEGIVGVEMASDAAALPGEQIWFKFFDSTASADVVNSEQTVQCWGPSTKGQVFLRALVNIGTDNHTLQLYGKTTVAEKATVIPERTSLSYIRLA